MPQTLLPLLTGTTPAPGAGPSSPEGEVRLQLVEHRPSAPAHSAPGQCPTLHQMGASLGRQLISKRKTGLNLSYLCHCAP